MYPGLGTEQVPGLGMAAGIQPQPAAACSLTPGPNRKWLSAWSGAPGSSSPLPHPASSPPTLSCPTTVQREGTNRQAPGDGGAAGVTLSSSFQGRCLSSPAPHGGRVCESTAVDSRVPAPLKSRLVLSSSPQKHTGPTPPSSPPPASPWHHDPAARHRRESHKVQPEAM